MIWTFLSRPDQALDALRAEVPPHLSGEFERTVGEAASTLPADLFEWTVTLSRYGPTVHVEPVREREPHLLCARKMYAPGPFVDTRHTAGRR